MSLRTSKAHTFLVEVRCAVMQIGSMLIAKNRAYGDSALSRVPIFSKADAEEGLRLQIDHKLARIRSDPDAFGEDSLDDLIGYLVLLKIARERKKRARKKRPSLLPNRANRN